MRNRWFTRPYPWSSWRNPKPPPSLAVLPLTGPEGEEPGLGVLLSAAIEQALRTLPGVLLVNRNDVHWVLSRMGIPQGSPLSQEQTRSAGILLGAEKVLSGTVSQRRGQTRVSLSLLDGGRGRITPFPEYQDNEPLLLLPVLIGPVIDALRIPIPSSTNRRLAALPTPSQKAFSACGWGLWWDLNPASFRQAQAAYQRALELDPHYACARKNLADLFLEEGRLEEAVKHYQQAIRDQPDLALAHNNLGVAYRRQGRWEEALRSFSTVLSLPQDRLARAYAHNNRGTVWRQQGQNQRATREYQTALQVWPRYAMARANLGALARAQGAEEEARRHFEEVARGGNELLAVVFSFRQLAHLYTSRGEWHQAAQVCREALALRPHDARTHLILGDSLLHLGHFPEAQAAFQNVFKWDRRPLLRVQARLRLGELFRNQQLWAEARREYRAALRIQPENLRAQQGFWEATGPG